MSTSFSIVSSSPFVYSSPSISSKPNAVSGRSISSAPASSNGWWSPLFGWSSDPDYIDNTASRSSVGDSNAPESGTPGKQSGSRFSVGCFTEEKAKQMRMKTAEIANFHDIMYHSAIASRLASETSER